MIQDILVPKNPLQVVDDLFKDHGRGNNNVNVVCNLIHEKTLRDDFVIALFVRYGIPAFNYKFIEITCVCDLKDAMIYALGRDYFDPTIYSNRLIRLAYDNDSYKIIRLLLKDKRVKATLEKKKFAALEEMYC